MRVIGVGSAGVTFVNRMIADNLHGVDFFSVDTDAEALARSQAPVRLLIGGRSLRSAGPRGSPGTGLLAAEESTRELRELLHKADIVYIVVGAGGGTGTTAAPVLARLAKLVGALTVVVATVPFALEGPRRHRLAKEDIGRLAEVADTVIVIPCQRLLELTNRRLSQEEAYGVVEGTVAEAVRALSTLMTVPGMVGLRFCDVRDLLTEKGIAMMGTGCARGESRGVRAAELALTNRLLRYPLSSASGVVLNVTGGMDLYLYEVNEVLGVIRQAMHPDALPDPRLSTADTEDLVTGVPILEGMGERLRVTFFATGLPADPAFQEE